MMKLKKPKYGDIIEITERNVSDKVQPLFAVGKRFIVERVVTKGLDIQLTVKHPNRKGRFLTMSSSRFNWRIVTKDELREEKFKAECRRNTLEICKKFSQQEQLNMAIVPLILNFVVWHYAMIAVSQAASQRISALKKATRAIRELHNKYIWELQKDLSISVVESMQQQTEDFISACAHDFNIFYFTVNREFKRKMPKYPYEEVRTFALMAIVLIRYIDEHNRRSDEVLLERIGHREPTQRNSIITALLYMLEALAGDVYNLFDYNERDVVLCQRILSNNILKIKFII